MTATLKTLWIIRPYAAHCVRVAEQREWCSVHLKSTGAVSCEYRSRELSSNILTGETYTWFNWPSQFSGEKHVAELSSKVKWLVGIPNLWRALLLIVSESLFTSHVQFSKIRSGISEHQEFHKSFVQTYMTLDSRRVHKMHKIHKKYKLHLLCIAEWRIEFLVLRKTADLDYFTTYFFFSRIHGQKHYRTQIHCTVLWAPDHAGCVHLAPEWL